MEIVSGALPGDGLLLEAFVPALVRRRLVRSPSLPPSPAIERFDAAVLVTDLSGFTSLAETFARRGPRGAEDLKDVLNFFCGHIAELVDQHGGEVVRFAGDAALALWPVGEAGEAAAARAAAQCATVAQRALTELAAPDGVRLLLRSGIGFGTVTAATVGGVAGRWELVVSGPALGEAMESVSDAASGDVAVGPAAWAWLSPHARGRQIARSSRRLDGLMELMPTAPPEPIAPCLDEQLRPYVPRSVQARVGATQAEWMAEFRNVSALFIKLGGLEVGTADPLDRLQSAAAEVQSAVYRYGGTINQLVVDDKGTVAVCGWGLAFHAHGDDQMRAVRAALDIRRGLQAHGVQSSCGIASGTVFTGLLGNRRRCSFAMIGDVVNVAARLMEAAQPGDVHCDLASFEAVGARVTFESLPQISVKGREHSVEVFRPLALASDGGEIVGRTEERQLLRERLDALARAGAGGVVFLEGDPGIGKSRLVADLIQRALAIGVRTMVASADAIERSAPYHVWCSLFDNLLGLERYREKAAAERRVIGLLESDPRLVPFAALLNPILRLNCQETEESERVPPRGRALLTRDLLLHLFRHSAGGLATLLVLEDAHWLDSSSWALAEALAREVPEVLIVISMRPLVRDEQPAECARLARHEHVLRLQLGALSAEEAQVLVCRRLRAGALTEPVARLIREKAEGHPFFSEELAYALRDKGLIRTDRGVCGFSPGTAATESVQLPGSVQVMVASRIDQLNADQQLTVKVASVLGRTLDQAALQAVYPIAVGRHQVQGHVEALVERELLQRTSSGPSPGYAFKHAITQEAAYSLLPFALRRQLHATAAAWYEGQHADDLSPFYALLAHHWARAEAGEQATFYLDKAGEQALKRHANEEALRFYRDAVDIDDRLAPPVPAAAPVTIGRSRVVDPRQARRIRWERRLGDAATNLSRWDDGRRHFTTLLTLTGRPLPPSRRSLTIGLGRQVGIQMLHRLSPRLYDRSSPDAAGLLREMVCAYERLGSLSYQDGQPLAVIYSLVAALNLAERLGPTSELGMVYADVGNVLGLIPVHWLARVYHRKAMETAAKLPDAVAAARVRARAGLYRLGAGDWSACRDLEASMAVCDQIGDSYVWEENAAICARSALASGDFHRGGQLGKDVRARASSSGSVPHEIWGIAAQAWASRFQGRDQQAIELAKSGLRLLASSGRTDLLATLDFHAAMALAHMDRQELVAAHQAADGVVAATAKASRLGYFAELAVSGAAEACLAVWEAGRSAGEPSALAVKVEALCRQLDRLGRINPSARTRAAMWRGCAEWLLGRHTRAQATWRRCLGEAERDRLTYEAARVRYEIGRRLEAPAIERRRLLGTAYEEFCRLKAEPDIRRVALALHVS